MREIFLWGGGGAGYLQMGRVRIRKKKEKWGRRGSVERPFINFFRWIHRRNKLIGDFVSYSDGKIDTSPHDTAFQIPRWFHRYCWRWTGHVTRTDLPFSNPSVIRSVFFTVNQSRHPYGSPISNPLVILSEKSPAKTSTSTTRPFFLNSELFVCIFDLKLPTEIFRRWFRCY